MLFYWSLFAVPVLAGFNPYRVDRLTRRIVMIMVWLLLTLVIGGRDVVGCDWDAYLGHFYGATYLSFGEVLEAGYPAYVFLNWLAIQLGFGVHAVNLVCAGIFSAGLVAFANRQPKPWLTIVAAIPYLVIVVAMGFTRQATAIGLLMFAYNAFNDRKLIRYLAFVGLAGLFHSSAVALAPMAVLMQRDRPFSRWVIGGGAAAILVLAILSSALDRYVYGYIISGEESDGEGAWFRLPMNALAGIAVLMYRRRWAARYDDARFFLIVALGCLALLPFIFFMPVVADRMSMYLLPFQIAVAARLPDLVRPRNQTLTAIGVVVLYALSLYVWLSYANHAGCWLPYSSVYF